MAKKKKTNIGFKIFVWIMLIAMVGSVVAGFIIYLI